MRVPRLVIVFAALALVLAACGDDDAETTEAPETTATTEAPPTTEADIPTLEPGILTVG